MSKQEYTLEAAVRLIEGVYPPLLWKIERVYTKTSGKVDMYSARVGYGKRTAYVTGNNAAVTLFDAFYKWEKMDNG